MRLALWPRGLIGRVGLVLFAAVLLEVIGSVVVFEQAEILSSDQSQAWRISEEVATAARVLGVIPPQQRTVVGRSMSSSELAIDWSDKREETAEPGRAPAQTLHEAILTHEPALKQLDLQLRVLAGSAGKALDGSLRLPDGSFLHFHAPNLETTVPALYAQLGAVALLSICVLVAALLLVRTLASPLALLAKATDAIGHGPAVLLDVHGGPREVRRVARAFNAMQERIANLITSRTEALASVSHDLRTPIARLRLRAGFLSDGDDRSAIEADLAEMEGMVQDLLDYLGGEDDPEKMRRTDLVALLNTLVEDAIDAGHVATYTGPDRLILDLRPRGIKRALSNIVNNALAYGEIARVSLTHTTSIVCIAIDDDGPGIPSADGEIVFEPFRRLEASRNRSTGGTGLGLTIARQAVQREGGTIELINRPEGGLRVQVSLPT